MITTMPMKPATFYLRDDDREAICLIREEYGLTSDAAALRMALTVLARRIRQERGVRNDDATDGERTSTERP